MFDLERKNGIPLYVQVARMISGLIADGTWTPGFKLPPERQLAQLLGVSRNTVSAAYGYLEERGMVSSFQGRGTFVSPDSGSGDGEPGLTVETHSLLPVVDALLELGMRAGIDPADTARLVQDRASVHQSRHRPFTVALVECNREQLDFFRQTLNLGPGARIIPILLTGESGGQEIVRQCDGVDLVVTTFFHLDEVSQFLESDYEVLGIALDPDLETMVRIAQLPTDAPVGLVCLSSPFAEKVKNSLFKAGLGHLDIRVCTPAGDLEGLLQEVGAVIVSPGRLREVRRLARPGTPVIEFIYQPDQGSIRMLSQRIAEILEAGDNEAGLIEEKGRVEW